MRWLVTGARGQVGSDLLRVLAEERPEDGVVGLGRADLDIASLDAAALASALAEHRPDVVVNCAAYTAVDAAETDEEAATAINGAAPGRLAAGCQAVGARLLHLSTDYVFDGSAQQPIAEDAAIDPRSAYGRSKAAGEQAVLAQPGEMYVVRTAWVWGETGGNFVKTIARLLRQRAEGGQPLDVVDDQRGTPTWSRDLARGLVELGAAPAAQVPGGVWHLTNSGETTWCGFARAIAVELGLAEHLVRPTSSDAFPRPAPRPAYSVLSLAKWRSAGLRQPPEWRAALTAAEITRFC